MGMSAGSPPGARGGTVVDVVASGQVRMRCAFCEACELIDDEVRLVGPDMMRSRVDSFRRKHWHEVPQPLTLEQRERVKVEGIHRRGALRCQP